MKLHVEGMTCGHCERAVREAIEASGGTARVDLSAGTVDVDGVEPAEARRAIEQAGYAVVDTDTP